ncbi:hypothetical protein QL285_056700 [Trifolium repens]|jgi:hypothetical protein|nr:hypothetical protein QL285_056700 [Trifolium repens]
MDQPPTWNKDQRTNNPLNIAAGIKVLSSKTIQTQSHGLRRIRRRCRSRVRHDALRAVDLNRPGTSENRRAQEHQHNQKPITDVFEPRLRDKPNMLETIQPFRVNRTISF